MPHNRDRLEGGRASAEITTPYLDARTLGDPVTDAQGSYRLCLRIASGGMATIYLAMYRGTDGLQRPVAIKLIHPHLARHTEFVEMFFDEAQLAARIDHPGVCALYDFGRTHDSYFLAMEYLVGETFQRLIAVLRQRAAATTMMRTPLYAARIVADVAETLHAVHEACDEEGRPLEIVHRDVTPHNLFVLYDGSVRVTDFGIARSRERTHHTQSGVLKGKAGYMAPEQLVNAPVDRLCDVWSLGVVLWELLANEALFTAANIGATIDAVQHKEVRAPSSLNPFVPASLDAIVLRALERDRGRRYRTARELALALEAFLSERKDTVPAADISAWLDHLFPGEAERRRELVAKTRAMVATSMPPPPLAPERPESLTSAQRHLRARAPRTSRLARGLGLAALIGLAGAAVALWPHAATQLPPREARASRAMPAATGAASMHGAIRAHEPTAEPALPEVAVPAARQTTAPVAVDRPAIAPAPASPQPVVAASDVGRPVRARPLRSARPERLPEPPAPTPATATATASASAQRGNVHVSTSEPADVFYRGKNVGRAPLGLSLPVGAQTIEVRALSGAAPVQVVVEVRASALMMARVQIE